MSGGEAARRPDSPVSVSRAAVGWRRCRSARKAFSARHSCCPGASVPRSPPSFLPASMNPPLMTPRLCAPRGRTNWSCGPAEPSRARMLVSPGRRSEIDRVTTSLAGPILHRGQVRVRGRGGLVWRTTTGIRRTVIDEAGCASAAGWNVASTTRSTFKWPSPNQQPPSGRGAAALEHVSCRVCKVDPSECEVPCTTSAPQEVEKLVRSGR